jgi:hypothetical protein
LIVDVPGSVATAMVAAGHVDEVPDTEGTADKPKRSRTRHVKDTASFDEK